MCFVSIGYVVRVQAGQAPMGVHNDRDYKRWREPPISRIPAAVYKTSSVDRGQSGNSYSAQEEHTAASKSSQIQSHYSYPVIPGTQNSNVPKSQGNYFKSGFNSALVTGRRSTVMYSGNKASAFPGGKKIYQANSDSVFSTGPVQVPPRIHRARPKSIGSFSPIQVDKSPAGFGPNNRKAHMYSQSRTASPDIQTIKSGYQSPYVFPSSFTHDRTNVLQKVLKSIDEETVSVVKTHSPGGNSAGKVDTQMSYPARSPRVYSSDGMPEARGYAHAHRLKPGFDKTQPQSSSAAGRKFLESFSHDSTKLGFGLGVPASSEGQRNLNYNSRGSQSGSWHPPPLDRAPIHVQGKFKPFQRLPTNDDLPAHTHSSESETAPAQPFAGTTLPPSLNTVITSSVVPSVTEELSTKSASPMQTEGPDEELVTQMANQSESSAEVGTSLESNKPLIVYLQPEEKETKGDQSPPEMGQSGV